jgi:hypothetical protein
MAATRGFGRISLARNVANSSSRPLREKCRCLNCSYSFSKAAKLRHRRPPLEVDCHSPCPASPQNMHLCSKWQLL